MDYKNLNTENLTLEVLVHFTDKDGKRIKPSCNRIRIPLQVSDITGEESAMITMFFETAIGAYLRDIPILRRLVLSQEKYKNLMDKGESADCILRSLVYFPILDNIKIL
ncbi:hypothetical protein EZS27_009193 [termite gut metagenome]|uniref:Uncharacterized protein n=1 Tax=termite gut metagenome TaxID=433724 RepID=A0A5J4SAP1_9ZZZZ